MKLQNNAAYMQPPTYLAEAPIGLSSAFIGRYVIEVKDLDPLDKELFLFELRVNGDAVNEVYKPFEANTFYDVFKSRTAFNYVRFSTLHINTEFNADISADVRQRLLSGVRFWHKKIVFGDYYRANIVR